MPATEASEGGEEEIDDAAVEVGFYEGNGVQLNDVLREVVLLALPMQLVCSESCKGICPFAGKIATSANAPAKRRLRTTVGAS